MTYSGLSLARHAVTGQRHWPAILPDCDLGASYDVVIIGGGGHGLATAYYLARQHGITNVAVFEAGWIGGGNTARNTTIVRSDYLLDASFQLKNKALGLWSSLSQDLNFNLMYSPRGYVDLAHSDGELEHFTLRANAMNLNGAQDGAQADILDLAQLQARVPQLALNDDDRFPVCGALVQEAGGVVRHDAVAWGFARQAAAAGVHVFQNCPVTGFNIENGRLQGVRTKLGDVTCGQAMISVAGASGQVTELAGFALPLSPVNVQAFVTEPVKPVLDCVVNYNAGLSYVSQTDKGELVLGGATDGYHSTARRGSFDAIENTLARAVQMFPFLSRLRLMRHWSGTADITMDGNAIMGDTPVAGLKVNAGWGYAGFKATPAVGHEMAKMLSSGTTPDLITPFALERFETGALIDDGGIGPYPWLH
ncbi:FAD-dependent oxidoreductase [Roseovarius sp. EL26]|uniref:FAD-dependent oxidoreductase n=1 Tax=Roseovarius sp. EL26 TaxID=2126672 RepID=UPI000EA1FF83|nr:FAD-dependent oxidoreductase [Roseovarius sp. EL26]